MFTKLEIAVVVIVLSVLSACSPLYVIRAGYEEAKILSRREPITELVRDTTVPRERREKLEMVLEVRAFANDVLELEVGDSYTTFSQLDSDTLALVLSASRKDRFEAYTWWFPIIGDVPYKGFFSEDDARDAIADLEEQGYDTYLRPTAAFSTLGWFNDPLVSTLLRYDSVSLANTVIHELFHNTLYLAGSAAFNESLANFVGARGAIAFFCGRPELQDNCDLARAAWRDELIFGRFLSDLVRKLETLYGREDLSRAQKLVLREEIFAHAQRRFRDEVQPSFEVSTFASFARTPLNNATLISRRLYYHRLDLFERVFGAYGRDLVATLGAVLEVASGSDRPYEAVEALVGG
ncbi:MAG TPA: aminopeptidase [Longimicrobiaceae bacterium]|nr:aminopeptidase [Longimicrobiaceae bacterium]